jgi:methionyl-tRNA formyltransferase
MILNATITINQEENAGQLHDRLMQQEETVIKTLTLIEEDNIEQHQTEN